MRSALVPTCHESASVMLSGLTKRETRGARLVVMANLDYFDPSLPRTAVQLTAGTETSDDMESRLDLRRSAQSAREPTDR